MQHHSLPLRLSGPVVAVMGIAFGLGLLALVAAAALAITVGESACMVGLLVAAICGATTLACAGIAAVLLACDSLVSR